jgi:hypothetical protein
MDSLSIQPVASVPEGATIFMCTDVPRFFWRADAPRPASWRAYLATNGSDIKPMALCTSTAGFLGAEQAVFVVDQQTGALLNKVTHHSFVQSIEQLNSGIVVACCEDLLLAFTSAGQRLWKTTIPDVIESLESEGQMLRVRTISGDEYVLDCGTGRSRAGRPSMAPT